MSMFKKVKSLFDNKDQPPGGSPNGSETSSPSSNGNPKIWAIPPSVREQFAKGGAVRYNIKVVLRGARRVGKSSVMARLQGTFQHAKYSPSDEISAATIYYQLERPPKANEEYEVEAAKVDLWDVVDEGRALPPAKGQPSGIPPRQPTDARSVDVYQNCHAAVFIVDVTRRDSWEYVVEEVKSVPSTCSICIALNFCDAPKPHAVTEREVVQLSNTLPRCCTATVLTACQGQVPPSSVSFGPTWVSLSALTGQGIDLLRSFLAVPVALERLQTLESKMKSIYSEIEVHQGMLLQRRAMEEFEAKEKQKSQSQTRENSVSAPLPPAVEALTVKKPEPVVEPRQEGPVKQQPQARTPSPKPQPLKEVVAAPQPLPAKQPSPSPTKQPSPPPAKEEPTVAKTVAATQGKPAPVATPTPPPTVAAKKTVAPAASQRTPEEEKRLQEDFYGDITDEDEESIEEIEEESEDEPILTPAARKAQLLQQQREQNTAAATAVESTAIHVTPVEPIPAPSVAKVEPQGAAASQRPTNGSEEHSDNSQELPTPPLEEATVEPAPEEPSPTHKPTWQEDAEKLANITVEDNVEGGAAGGGKGLDAFLEDSEDEEETQKPDEAIEPEVEEEVVEKEDSPSEEEPTPVPRGRQHRDPTRVRGSAPVTVATPEPSAAAAAPISDEVSEMLKQMAAAMQEEIKEGKKAKGFPKSKKSKEDAEEGGEGTEKKKEKKAKSEKRQEGEGGEKDKSDKKEKTKKEKKDKKKVDDHEE